MDTIELEDEKAREELRAVMKEISLEMHKIEVSRDQIKEIIEAASETFDIEKPLLRKVSRLYHKKNIADYRNESDAVKSLYEQVTA